MRININVTVTLFTLLALVGCGQSSDDKKPANVAGDQPAAKAGEQRAATPSGSPAETPAAPAAGATDTLPAAVSTAAAHVDLRFAPKEAFAAFVAFPRRVLTSGELGKLDLSGPFAKMDERLGFSLRDTVQLVSFAIVTPGDGPQAAPNFGGGIEVVLSKPLDPTTLVPTLMEKQPTETAKVAGKRYVRPKADPTRAGARPMCFALIDDFTFLLAPEAEIKLMLTAADTKTPLTALIGKLDPHADLAVIATNPDELRKMIDAQMKSGQLPPALAPYAAAPELIDSTTLSFNSMPEISIHWSIESRDEAGAKKLAEMLTQAGQMAQAMLPGLHQAAEGTPAEMKAAVDYGLGLATKLAAGLTPKQTGNQVALDIQGLGTLDDLAAKLIAPGLDAAKLAAERAQRFNNLKQLALSIMNLMDLNGKYPPAAIYSKDGKALLSWRVAVLPYIEEQTLYKKFHLDEPWDSPNNKPLIAEMPKVFLAAGEQNPEGGRTRFLVPTGKGTIFEGPKGIGPADVPDGTSNTLLIVEVGHDKAVIWTKPEDISVDPEKPAAGLGDIGSDGFAAAFADGSVRLLKKGIDADTLRKLFLRDDGQPVDPGKL